MNGATGREREERAVDALARLGTPTRGQRGGHRRQDRPEPYGGGEGRDERPGEQLHPAAAGRRAAAWDPAGPTSRLPMTKARNSPWRAAGPTTVSTRAEEVDDETTKELEQREREILDSQGSRAKGEGRR